MMGMSFSHLLVILLIIFILFGAGKLPQVMRDLAKGLKAFKEGLKDDDKDKKND
jgi:sec-independent protein translocase protein TatA